MNHPPSNSADLHTHLIAERYRSEEKIGSGGMGTVWRGYDSVLKRRVAMKNVTIPQGIPEADAAVLRERSVREARAAAPIRHYNVVSVYDIVEESPHSFWIITEYIDAENLSQRIRRAGPLTPEQTADIAEQLLDALSAAHNIGVLHRDVKPANVLLASDRSGSLRAVLTDFGIAQITTDPSLTRTGQLIGSPVYMPPERLLTTKSATEKTDMWALGCTLYAAVEGRLPFPYTDQLRAITAITVEPIPPTHRAGVLAPVITGLLQKDPDQRWSVAHTQRAVHSILRHKPLSTEDHWGAVPQHTSAPHQRADSPKTSQKQKQPQRRKPPQRSRTPGKTARRKRSPKRSTHRYTLTVLALLAALTLIGDVVLWRAELPLPGSSAQSSGSWQVNGEEFVNEESGYALVYPPDWEHSCSRGNVCSFRPGDNLETPFQMLVIAENTSGAQNASLSERERNITLPEYKQIVFEQRSIGGVTGWWLEYTFLARHDNTLVTRHIQVFRVDATEIGGSAESVYALSLNGPLGIVEEYEHTLRRAIASLRAVHGESRAEPIDESETLTR